MTKTVRTLICVGVMLCGVALGFFFFPSILLSLLSRGGSQPSGGGDIMVFLQIMGMAVGCLFGYAFALPLERYLIKLGDPVVSPQEYVEITVTGTGADEQGQAAEIVLLKGKIPSDRLASFWMDPAAGSAMRLRKADGAWVKLSHAADSPYSEADSELRPVIVSLRQGGHVLYTYETSGGGRFVTPEGAGEVSLCRFELRHLGCEEADQFATLKFKGPTSVMKEIFLS